MSVQVADRAAAPALQREVAVRPRGRTWRVSRRQLGLAGAALLVGIGAAWYGNHWWTVGRFIESTDDAYVGGDVTVIAPKVSGFVAEVAVTDNQAVHAGDLLVKLDDRDYRPALANLDATRHLQQALIAQAQAGIAAADAEIIRAHDDQVRFRDLSAHAAA